MMSKEAMKLALEALQTAHLAVEDDMLADEIQQAITAMREAQTQRPAQLPFGVGGGLVAIKTLLSRDPCVHANTAIQMIDAILAEQPAQQEPVGWIGKDSGVFIKNVGQKNVTGKPLYTSPPAQRTWVGLSDAQNTVIWANSQSVDEAIRATEKQLMENNI